MKTKTYINFLFKILLCNVLCFHAYLFSQDSLRPRVALVLSGGGARGISQIGALRVLEQNNIPIDFIVGNSMGSVVGGLYASGYSVAEIESITLHTDWNKLLSISGETERQFLYIGQKQDEEQGFLLFRMDGFQPVLPSGISSGQRITNFLNELCLQSLYYPQQDFDKLKIPFRSVATDLISGKRVVMERGSLTEALRASISVPLMFSPLIKDSMVLLDGGLISNIPVDIAQATNCDIIIAVNTTSELRSHEQLDAPWESADQIMNIMTATSNQEQLSDANIIITPALGNYLSSDFSRLPFLISQGEKAAQENLPLIQKLFNEKQAEKSAIIPKEGADSSVKQFPLLRALRFEGKLSADDAVLRKMLHEFFGKEITLHTHKIIRERILKYYRNAGLSIAEIDSFQISSDGELLFNIDEGYIDSVKVVGNYRTQSYVILRELPFETGDIFTIENMREGRQNIMSTGLFDQVYIEVEKEFHKNIIAIHVREKSSELVRTGFRFDNERNFQFLLDVRQANVFSAGQDFGFTFAGGFRDRLFRVRYNVNRLFNTYFTGNIKAHYKFRDVYTYKQDTTEVNELYRSVAGEYRQIKYGGTFLFGTQVARFGNVTAEWRVEDNTISKVTANGFSPERFTLSSISFNIAIDSENDYVFPTSGIRFHGSYEIATKEIGSERSYTKLYASHQSFWTLFRSHTLRPRITFGFADATLPLSEKFSLGGLESFYGLQEDDTRGRQLFLINMEYRYFLPFRIFFDTYFKVRYDLGMLSDQIRSIAMRNFQHGAGVELALDTPIGSASFALGKEFIFKQEKKVLKSKVEYGPTLFYFSIGHRF
ncbi:MAG: BamA/TamA family outer membrane protein [Ignavibacteriales bacterium]|nr:BamA/TamA family outer membrane protein [Ignavibacteriales bacterium]